MLLPITIDVVSIPQLPDLRTVILRIPISDSSSAVFMESFQIPVVRSQETYREAIEKVMSTLFSQLNAWSGKGAEVRKLLGNALADDLLSK